MKPIQPTELVFDPALPLEQACTIPNRWYTDAEILAAEKAMVFGRHWVVVGRFDQVSRPGEYLTCHVGDEPIIVLRGEDGELRGFFNVCRHRAARVMTHECGVATKLRCPYHGWTYDLHGQLRGVPEFEGVENFQREENGLWPVHVATWGPLVFVHLGEPAMSLEEFLHPLGKALEPFAIDQLRFYGRQVYDLACNWKVYCDNYLDGGYHVNSIHPALAGVLDYKNYRTELFNYFSVQSSPMKAPDAADDPSAAMVRTGPAAAYVYLYPNFMINCYSGVMDTNTVLPLGPERCRVIFDFYFAPTNDPTAEHRYAQSMMVADKIQAEDVAICEDVQRGLHSRAFTSGRFSVRREAGVYHFHRLLAADLKGGSGMFSGD